MNKEFLGDRRRALEEEYFVKLNRALLEPTMTAALRGAAFSAPHATTASRAPARNRASRDS